MHLLFPGYSQVIPRLTICSFIENSRRSWVPVNMENLHRNSQKPNPYDQKITVHLFLVSVSLLILYSSLNRKLWSPSWQQNVFKNEAPYCSLTCGSKSLASKYYSNEDFTDFYFILNVYPLVAIDNINRASCSGISSWAWNLRMPFELIVPEFCLHANATRLVYLSQQTGKCGRSEQIALPDVEEKPSKKLKQCCCEEDVTPRPCKMFSSTQASSSLHLQQLSLPGLQSSGVGGR